MARMASPFDPSKKAYLETIAQPLYTSNVYTPAAPQPNIIMVPVPPASAGDTSLSNFSDNKVGSPKMFVIKGYRLHASQNVPWPELSGAVFQQLVQFVEAYSLLLKIGSKDYFTVPLFYMKSGLGVNVSGVGALAAGAAAYNASLGIAAHENYVKIPRHNITLPPMQEFSLNFVRSAAAPAGAQAGANLRLWWFFEGDMGREVQ